MTTICTGCGKMEGHESLCPFVNQQQSFEQRGIFAGGSALKKQVDGGHYKDLKIQPLEYIHANNIPFAEGCVIKYVSRWRSKGGIKDLEKAKHFLELLIELESRA